MLSGFPVVAALMCVEHHDQLVQNIDSFIDQVNRKGSAVVAICLLVLLLALCKCCVTASSV